MNVGWPIARTIEVESGHDRLKEVKSLAVCIYPTAQTVAGIVVRSAAVRMPDIDLGIGQRLGAIQIQDPSADDQPLPQFTGIGQLPVLDERRIRRVKRPLSIIIHS